jgi:PKD repeat protein
LDGDLEIENVSTGAGGYYWTFGDGANSTEENPLHTYTDEGVYEVNLTVYSTDGNCSDQQIVEVDVIVVSVDELGVRAQLWPNPATASVIFESTQRMDRIDVYTHAGQLVESSMPNGMRHVLDVSGWPAGVYVAQIATAAGTKSVKLIRAAQ